MQTVGKRLKELRLRLGMTQKQLASLSNITTASLSRYENGVRRIRSDKLAALAQTLDVSVDYLLVGPAPALEQEPDASIVCLKIIQFLGDVYEKKEITQQQMNVLMRMAVDFHNE